MKKEEIKKGLFYESLIRNNDQIKSDRAQSIYDDTQIVYKRMIEDYERMLVKLKKEQTDMLDLSPKDAQSLVLAKDFDSLQYVKNDIDLGMKILNVEFTLDIARKRYNELF